MTTCFSRGDIKRLYELGFRHVKVASYDCASFQMLREIAQFNWEIIVSTGATFDNEISKAAKILGIQICFPSLCYDISIPIDEVHISRMNF